MDDSRVIILTGVRRSGKSTLLKQIMQETKTWCYVNFEDERLLQFKAQDFEQLNEALIESYGNVQTYFFDEIQNIDKFETFVRRLQDEGKKIIITGSNAVLLSKEFGTRLTGRYKSFEVYPFSFNEFLKFRNIPESKDNFIHTEKRVEVISLFAEYLSNGGLPEYLKNHDKEYIRTLFENIIYKDIITRYSIRGERAVKELVSLLATNISSPFTYNALKNSLGLSNAITVKDYISHLQNAYVFFELRKHSPSLKLQLSAPRKVYLIDSAIHQVTGANYSPNKGKILENTVFIELKRRNKEIYYFADKHECDFVIKEGTEIVAAIQACYALDEVNKEREINGLIEAMEKFKLREGTILTFEQTEEIIVQNNKIRILPVYRWIMDTTENSTNKSTKNTKKLGLVNSLSP